jgi:hypothetical protein
MRGARRTRRARVEMYGVVGLVGSAAATRRETARTATRESTVATRVKM